MLGIEGVFAVGWLQTVCKPDSVTQSRPCGADHSSSAPVARRLMPPTRSLLPGRNQATAYLVLLPVEIARFTRTKPARLCCSNPRLTAGRRYLLRRPAESGLSSCKASCPRSAVRLQRAGLYAFFPCTASRFTAPRAATQPCAAQQEATPTRRRTQAPWPSPWTPSLAQTRAR